MQVRVLPPQPTIPTISVGFLRVPGKGTACPSDVWEIKRLRRCEAQVGAQRRRKSSGGFVGHGSASAPRTGRRSRCSPSKTPRPSLEDHRKRTQPPDERACVFTSPTGRQWADYTLSKAARREVSGRLEGRTVISRSFTKGCAVNKVGFPVEVP